MVTSQRQLARTLVTGAGFIRIAAVHRGAFAGFSVLNNALFTGICATLENWRSNWRGDCFLVVRRLIHGRVNPNCASLVLCVSPVAIPETGISNMIGATGETGEEAL